MLGHKLIILSDFHCTSTLENVRHLPLSDEGHLGWGRALGKSR